MDDTKDGKEIIFLNENKNFYQKLSFQNAEFQLFNKFNNENESIGLIDNYLNCLQIDDLNLNLFEIEDFYTFREKLLKIFKDKTIFENQSEVISIIDSLLTCENISKLCKIILDCYLNEECLLKLVNDALISLNQQFIEKIKYILFTIMLNFKKQFSLVKQIKKGYIYTKLSNENLEQIQVNNYFVSQQLLFGCLDESPLIKVNKNCVIEIYFSKLDKQNYFANYIEILPLELSVDYNEILIAPFTKFKIHSIEKLNNNDDKSIDYRIKVKEMSENLMINNIFICLLSEDTQKNQYYFEKMLNYYEKIINSPIKFTKDVIQKFHFNEALLLYYYNNYTESKQAFSYCLTLLPSNHIKEVLIYNFLGNICKSLRDDHLALQYFEKARALLKSNFSDKRSEIIMTSINIGFIYKKTKKYSLMLKEFEECLEIINTLDDKDELIIANIHSYVGLAYENLENYKRAVESYQISLEIKSKIFCENTLVIAKTLNYLACSLLNLKEYNKALEYFDKSMQIKIQLEGENNSWVTSILNNMGLIYDIMNNNSLAEKNYEKALKISIEINGVYHADTASYLFNLAGICEKNENMMISMEHYKKALRIKIVLFGENNISVSKIYLRLANLYEKLNEHSSALKLYEKSLSIKISLLGDKDLSVACNYTLIGKCYDTLKEFEKAVDAYYKSLNIYLNYYQNEDNPLMATVLNNIASSFYSLGNYTESIKYFCSSLDIKIALFGKLHSSTITTFNNIKKAYNSLTDKKNVDKYLNSFKNF